ncbi:Sucrase/ferredoxin-like-domain-containing protein [Melanogaster broomeanus]|nr:Sucrase/ferredoxin-like-domain-containing protein [Melanogaster broomeanus]
MHLWRTLRHLPNISTRLRIPSRALSTSTTTSETTNELPGTAAVHRCYVFLHTPQPPSEYPPKYATPVQRKLLVDAMKWGGSVNFSWSEEQATHAPRTRWGGGQASVLVDGVLECSWKVGGSGGVVGECGGSREAAKGPCRTSAGGKHPRGELIVSQTTFTCTCARMAREIVDAGIREAQLHALSGRSCTRRKQINPSDPSSRIKLAEVAHVGGHKYAANVLVYPHGEWLGEVEPENVPEILDGILERPVRPMHAEEMPICPSHWRGRMGLGKEEQIELFNRLCAELSRR